MLAVFPLFFLLAGSLSASGEHNIVKKSGKIAAAPQGPPYPLWHLEPLYVKKLPAKTEEKREASPLSRSQVQGTHSVITDVNGQRNSLQQQIQKVSKNGKLLSKVYQQEKANSKTGHKPHFQKLTKIDIPELDLHQQFFDDSEEDEEAARTNHVKRNQGGLGGVRMPSPEDLAEYILATGDQGSVVDLIEGVVNNGKMSEEQALVYVETIKAMLDSAEKEETEIREMLLERKLEEAAAQEEAEREEALRNLLRRAPQGQLRGGAW